MTVFNILLGLTLGYFIPQILVQILASFNNFIEIKVEPLVVTSRYTKKTLDSKGFEVTKHVTTFIYKGKNIKTNSSKCYSKAEVGKKMNVKMKLMYKHGKLRKFDIIDFE